MARNSSGGFFNRFLDFIGLVDEENDSDFDEELDRKDNARVYNPASRRTTPEARPVRSAQSNYGSQQERYTPTGRSESNVRTVKPYEGDRRPPTNARSSNPYDYEPSAARSEADRYPTRAESTRTQSSSASRSDTDSRNARDEFSAPSRQPAQKGGGNAPERPRNNVVSMRGEINRHQTVIYYLRSLEECRNVINDLIDNKTVLLNLEDMDERLIQRGIDTLSGAAFALNATLRKASDKTYLIAPNSVEVASTNDVERRY